MVDICEATEERVFWNKDTFSFVKGDYFLSEGIFKKYVMYHQGTVYDIKVCRVDGVEQLDWSSYLYMDGDSNSYRHSMEDYYKFNFLVCKTRNLIINDHLLWYYANNHKAIRRNFKIADLLS